MPPKPPVLGTQWLRPGKKNRGCRAQPRRIFLDRSQIRITSLWEAKAMGPGATVLPLQGHYPPWEASTGRPVAYTSGNTSIDNPVRLTLSHRAPPRDISCLAGSQLRREQSH